MPLFVVLKYQTVNADVYEEKVEGVNCHIKYCPYCPYGYRSFIALEAPTKANLSLSEYVTGAVDVCLGCDEEELRSEKEKKLAELEKSKQEKIQE